MICRKAPSALLLASLLLVPTGARLARAQPEAGCEESGTLSEFIACLKDRAQPRPQRGEQRVCSVRPRVAVPVAGRRVLSFGDATGHNRRSNGIVIEGAAGAAVAAPLSGKVLFSGGWRDYGQLLIVDAGCNAEVLLAGLFSAKVVTGEPVEQGAIIGTMSEYASSDLPVLYVELREDGIAVDPDR
jgi:septal ring factor EnvC (AmiA/AmiB activator)